MVALTRPFFDTAVGMPPGAAASVTAHAGGLVSCEVDPHVCGGRAGSEADGSAAAGAGELVFPWGGALSVQPASRTTAADAATTISSALPEPPLRMPTETIMAEQGDAQLGQQLADR